VTRRDSEREGRERKTEREREKEKKREKGRRGERGRRRRREGKEKEEEKGALCFPKKSTSASTNCPRSAVLLCWGDSQS